MSLCQHFTPAWLAEALVERHFSDLGFGDVVLDPSCGEGAFLRAVPPGVIAWGVEVDPVVAQAARNASDALVLTGDFLCVDLPGDRVSAIVGNPPFRGAFIDRMLARCYALLPEEGRAGFILPAYAFRTAARVVELSARWSIAQEMLPRSAFAYRMREPLIFAMFTKDQRRSLVGFAFYAEEADRQAMAAQYRRLLASTSGSSWRAVCQLALKRLGGEADLAEIYGELQRNRPSRTTWWREKIRQTLRHYSECFRPVRDGRYALVAV